LFDANVKFRTLTEGPILVSDASGTSIASGSFQGSLVNGNVTASNVNFNFNTYKLESSTTVNNLNIQNILTIVDSNNSYSVEEKAQVKDALTKINEIILSTGSTGSKIASLLSLLASIFQ
jgi:hypothetical protein